VRARVPSLRSGVVLSVVARVALPAVLLLFAVIGGLPSRGLTNLT